ncbi:hypothetical protein C8R45DRAFT_1110351 [Mycena sanguinolenta]|nr:hypothetical protein C8R45DRAFT_1110351 [Mycena sanguinolenta]
MSTKRKAQRTPSPTASSIDEFINRYSFTWVPIPSQAPVLVKHAAWLAANTNAGRALVKAALRILNKEYSLSTQDALDILEEGISTCRLMCFKIDASKPIPADLGCFFAGVATLVRHAGKSVDAEWDYCPRPSLPKKFVPYALDIRPLKLEHAPSAQALQDAPELFTENPDFANPPPPVKRRKQHAASSPDPSDLVEVASPPASTASPEPEAEKSVHWDEDVDDKPKKKKGKSREVDTPDAPSLPATRQTRQTKSSSSRGASGSKTPVGDKDPDVLLVQALQPLIEKKMLELAKQSGFGSATVSLKDNSILATITLTRKQPGTIPKARSHLGVVDHHRVTKRDDMLPIEEIEPLQVEPFRQLDIKDAVQPLIGCGLCRLYEIICRPNGVGMACHNCARKRFGLLCDHAMGTLRFTTTMYEMAYRASRIIPTLPISIPRLEEVTLLARSARATHLAAQNELILHLRTLFDALRQQMHQFGDSGFAELFAGLELDESPVDLFNNLIGTFNKAQRFDEEVDDGLTDKDADGSVPTTTKPSPSTSDDEEPEAPVVATPSKPSSKKSPSSSPKKPPSSRARASGSGV